MSLQPEPRTWAPPTRNRARKDVRVKPYSVAQLSDRVDDLADGIDDILFFLAALRHLADRAVKWGKILGPLLIGALLASGVVTGPLGQALKYLSEHIPAS